MVQRYCWRRAAACVLLLSLPLRAAAPTSAPARELVAVEGKGYLERVDGYPVLHLKGTPEEMGFQHGRLFAEHIRQNVAFMLDGKPDEEITVGPLKLTRGAVVNMLNMMFSDKIPPRFRTEMESLARGSGVPAARIIAANLIPELFHCSGFALLTQATADGELLHGRVLDYGVSMHLQDHAVLIIQEPDNGISFVNVSYAGFIGSVTGMNREQISIGEMGGRGEGQWQGIPMTFLVRMVLEQARTLDEAIGIFQNNPRTCEYYYVIADARANTAVGMKAVPDKVELIRPGAPHELLPKPVQNTVLMSAGSRYEALTDLVAKSYGKFTQDSAVRLMDAPVAMKSNLHNALMVPGKGILWVANADKEGNAAWKQKYYRFDWWELLKTRPTAAVIQAAGR